MTEAFFPHYFPEGHWRPFDDTRLMRVEDKLNRVEEALARIEAILSTFEPTK